MHPVETEDLTLTFAAALHLRNKSIFVWSFPALTVWGVRQPGQVSHTQEECSSRVLSLNKDPN